MRRRASEKKRENERGIAPRRGSLLDNPFKIFGLSESEIALVLRLFIGKKRKKERKKGKRTTVYNV